MPSKVPKLLIIAILAAVISACSGVGQNSASNTSSAREAKKDLAELRASMKKIEPFFKPMGKPGPIDWMATNKEQGQTFEEYIDGSPTVPTDERKIIYVQPLGSFTAEQTRVIKTTSDYIEAFYGLKVKSLPPKTVPAKLTAADERMIDYPKHRQVRSGYILEKMLQPALPEDAAALIAFTNVDLYPDTSMYFVFGQASLENRVGVWSLYRLNTHANYDTFLARTMKIAVHETGHMFSMRHCTKYECVMSGTNHLGETDRRPIDACPECMAKICWMMKQSPKNRYNRLVQFAAKHNMTVAEKDFEKKSRAIASVE
ncbi:MAG TPA: archaemetzincin [Pyrinomonadaceae bacterium]|nr:archaemetzincin [Pyrinomonadaceae bacterium]